MNMLIIMIMIVIMMILTILFIIHIMIMNLLLLVQYFQGASRARLARSRDLSEDRPCKTCPIPITKA